jgi:hypothetical protein
MAWIDTNKRSVGLGGEATLGEPRVKIIEDHRRDHD